jgi:hypothetical protein
MKVRVTPQRKQDSGGEYGRGGEAWIIGDGANALVCAHELGHNFGIAQHASSPTVEGGDHSSVMGLPQQPGIGALTAPVHFNPIEKLLLG